MSVPTVAAIVTSVLIVSAGYTLGAVAAAEKKAAPAASTSVCGPLTSGKIDTTGDPESVTVSEEQLPDGALIVRYCVKAGSDNHGDGPLYFDVAPTSNLVIEYPGGKAVSHYSLCYQGNDCGPGASASPLETSTSSPSQTPAATTEPTPTPSATSTPGPGPDEEEAPSSTPDPQPTVDPTPGSTATPSAPPPAPVPPAPKPDPAPRPGFDWDWRYPAPSCRALSVTYPADIPAGQANDANVRFRTPTGSFTLNFHNNGGTWSGSKQFVFASHPNWPAGLTAYEVVWVQVGGTNYHWSGSVACTA